MGFLREGYFEHAVGVRREGDITVIERGVPADLESSQVPDGNDPWRDLATGGPFNVSTIDNDFLTTEQVRPLHAASIAEVMR